AESIKEVPSELQAIVSKLKALTERLSIQALPQPWLPPLEKEIFLQDLRPAGFEEMWGTGKLSTEFILGMVDLPSQQDQQLVRHNFNEDGNLALFSSPGMGKSTFLQSMVMDLARHKTPEQVQFYLFDFGTNGLLPLTKLPHIADHLSVDSDEKLVKVIPIIRDEVTRRKKLFGQYVASNIGMYVESSGESMSQIVLVIDGYDGIKEAKNSEALESLFLTLSRDGASLGIYLAITASRTGAIRPALLTNIKQRLTLKMSDDTEARSIVGRTSLVIEDLPGRGLIPMDQPELLQIALPSYGENSIQMIHNLKVEIDRMDRSWKGNRPKKIPIVPEVLSVEQFKRILEPMKEQASNQIPLGLDLIDVEPVWISLEKMKHLVVLGDQRDSIKGALTHILMGTSAFSQGVHTLVVDGQSEYSVYQSKVGTYINGDHVAKLLPNMLQELESRKQHPKTKHSLILIPDLAEFIEIVSPKLEDFTVLFNEGPRYGLHFVFGSQKSSLFKTDSVIKLVKENIDTALVVQRLYDQTVLAHKETSREATLAKDEVYLYQNNQYVKTKIIHSKEWR
ncbi:TPA: NACHT domain-containing protein, partial [Streptococcus suis]|nr:NACHT domain-containing protein [Streptococcus suis]